ncbi:MAG: RIP metalloprotease RseP [Acidobacteriota bacterium]|nr:RIP metalloprotease RseP [Acidobacteriota bacterium]
MSALHNIVWLLVLIGVMILVHELGHFWAARFFDVRVDVFSFGFGPRLFGFKRGETDYRLSAVLFGGYVKMAGDQPGEEGSDDPRAFLNKPRWQRLIIAVAGPAMNILLSVGILAGLFMVHYQKVVQDGPSVIGHIEANSAAAKAGLQTGDVIARLDGKNNPSWEDITLKTLESAYKTLDLTITRGGRNISTRITPVLDDKEGIGDAGWDEDGPIEAYSVSPGMPAQKAGLENGDLLLTINSQPIRSRFTLLETIRQSGGKPVTITVQRKGKELTFPVTPTFSKNDGKPRWMIGVAPDLKRNIYSTQLSLPAALKESVSQNAKNASLILGFLKGMIERRLPPKSLEGPIGIARRSGEAASQGAVAFLALMTVVSLNLAIFNLLPIPILDGGVIVLLLVEMIMGRDVSMTVKENILKVGFVFLMMIVVLVLYNDISKLI